MISRQHDHSRHLWGQNAAVHSETANLVSEGLLGRVSPCAVALTMVCVLFAVCKPGAADRRALMAILTDRDALLELACRY